MGIRDVIKNGSLRLAQQNIWMDQEQIIKPIIDEYEKEEIDLRICYVMEYNYQHNGTYHAGTSLKE